MFPIALVVSVATVLVRLVRNSEMIAIQSFGQSYVQVLKPLVAICILLSLGQFVFGEFIVPQTMDIRNKIYYVDIRNKPERYSSLSKKDIWYRWKNSIFHFDKILQNQFFQNPQVYEYDDDWKLKSYIQAETAKADTEGNWIFTNGTIIQGKKEEAKGVADQFMVQGEQEDNPVQENFETLERKDLLSLQDIKLPPYSRYHSFQTLKSLGEEVRLAKVSGLDPLIAKSEWHKKLSFPFMALVLVFLILPFLNMHPRRAKIFVTLSFCIGVTFLNVILFEGGLSLARAGTLSSFVGAWAGHALMLCLMLIVFVYRKYHKKI